ncbi:MAG: HD domain-containing protein, partial [Chloroflexota bacterium]|nr:HD domain-containing protein [Chloroflexota bacterium]
RLDRRLRRSIDFAVHGREFMVEGLRNTAETAARLARRLDRSTGVQDALRFVFEQWNGTGPYARRAESIPLVSRIIYATIFLEIMHQLGGREAAISLARGRRGKTLDPDVIDAFLLVASRPDFWRGLEEESVWSLVREMEPDSPYRYLGAERIDEVARAFADFADLKSIYSAGHSRRVAALAERTAARLQLPHEHVGTIRRAALMHDLGLVAVPSFILHKPSSKLGPAESDTLRLHPHHSERILARVPVFLTLCPIVVAHHERPDGEGYPRGLRGEQVPIGARVIAAADVFDELAHARPDGDALQPGQALHSLARESGTRFDRAVLDALAQVLDLQQPPMAPESTLKHNWPAGLSDREVEVLRSLASGASRRVIAARLTVSEHTVRHHLEHIYAKIDVRTRVEATLFALEHDLVR